MKGYAERASEAAKLANPDILMAFFLVEKAALAGDAMEVENVTRRGDVQPHVDIDLHVR